MNDLTISDFQKIIFANNITENIDNTTSIADIKTLSAAYPYVVFFTNISSENDLLNGEGNIWNNGHRLTKFVGLNPVTQYIEFGGNKIGLNFDSHTGLLGLVNANQIKSIKLTQIIYIDCNDEGHTIEYNKDNTVYIDSKHNTFKLIFEFVLGEHANVDTINHTLNIKNKCNKYDHSVVIVDGGTLNTWDKNTHTATFVYNCNIFYDTARRKGDATYTNVDKFDFTSVYDISKNGTIENLYLILNPNRKYLITQNGRLIITDVEETPVTLNPNWVYNDFYFSVTPVFDDEYPIYYDNIGNVSRKLCFTLEPKKGSTSVVVNDPTKGITPTYNIESGHVKFMIETKQPATEAELTTWVDIKVGKLGDDNETITVYDYLTKRLYIKINNSLFRYWYVGDEELTSSSMPGEGTIYEEGDPISIGWHRLGSDTNKVDIGTIGDVAVEKTWYIAAPSASKLSILRSGEDFDNIYTKSLIEEFIIPYKLTLANGATYNIFKVDLNRFQYTLTFDNGDYDPSNGIDYVNFNGVNWATRNVGADSPTGIGEYFQWADIEGYNVEEIGEQGKQFTLNNYKYYTESNYTKYNSTDAKVEIETNDDGSRSEFKGSWKIPTKQDFDSLIECTNQEWKENYNDTGVNGILFTDKEDETKTLFLPTTGQASDKEIINITHGTYWSRDITSNIINAYCLDFQSINDIQTSQSGPREDGYVIRPVFYDAQP